VKIIGLEELNEKKFAVPEVKFKGHAKALNKVRFELIELGYLGCSIDSITKVDSLNSATAYFYLGSKYSLAGVRVDSISKVALEESGRTSLLGRGKKMSTKTYARIVETVLTYYENHGYPFATVELQQANWNENILEGVLATSLNDKVSFGEIALKGNLEVDQKVLNLMIGFQEGDLYSEEQLDRVDSYLKGYPFIKIVKPTEYEFVNNECNVFLYLDKQNANFFNAILGVLPNDNGEINITGDAKIKLVNTLNKGEQFLINWRKLLPLTQNLNLEASVPYLFKMPVGVGGNFDLYKKDTSYLDVISKLKVTYRLGQNLSFAGFFRNRTSSLLSTEKYQFATVLPEFADIRNNEYGISGRWQNLDFIYNPSKGWLTEIEVSVGDKKINKNSALNEELYEGLNLRTTQFYLKGNVERYIKLYKKNVLKIGASGGWVLNENLFTNELFRLGGLNTLRGFDEESIFASGFALGTVEYRFLLEEFSNLFVFGQMMYYEQSTNALYQMDMPYSFGAGINFQTRPGIFSISYSLGSQQGNPILLRSAKIHFGFVNYF
jgi:outer membrane protein assembly factor BamA